MKQDFPMYDKRALKPLYKTFKKKDRDMIEEYLVFCGGTPGKSTLAKYKRTMIKACDVIGGDLDKIDLKRLREFLNVLNQSNLRPATKNEVRKVFKRFLKEHYSDWSSRFKQLDDIKGEAEINQDKINGNTILRNNEIETLVRGCESLKYKSLIMLMYESAGRPEEILNLKWRDVNLNRGDVKLKSSKTGNVRVNPIQESIIHLKRHKQEYPFPNVNNDDLIFPSVYNRDKVQSLPAFGMYLKKLGFNILKRPIFPYLIRHTRATELQKTLPAKIYEKFMDHSIETATRYSHLDKEDVRDAMFKNVYSVEELAPEKKHKLEKENEEIRATLKEVQKQLLGFKEEFDRQFNPEDLEDVKVFIRGKEKK